MLFWHKYFLLIFLVRDLSIFLVEAADCHPIYVRWPRVRLNNHVGTTKNNGATTLSECQNVCTNDTDSKQNSAQYQCSAFNYRSGFSSYANECQIFSREHVQHTDGYMEADDRYTFYWKFCVNTVKNCTGEYAFTFLSDRFMLKAEVNQIKFTKSLEECLSECLKSTDILCRSVSFNRTDGGCHLSQQNQLSKPSAIHINNNPNYRIDYYENNCYNNSFKFTPICEPNGIRIRVNSRIPYTGALYGLYDFFSCRIEPKEEKQFEFLFPYPNLARNCSDSMRQTGDEVVLEVVLSTDGVEPLYFITADDLTYQARCPLPKSIGNPLHPHHYESSTEKGDKPGASINSILEALNSASASDSYRFGTFTEVTTTESSSNSQHQTDFEQIKTVTKLPFTKDIFTLPLYTPATETTMPEKKNEEGRRSVQIHDSINTQSQTEIVPSEKSAKESSTQNFSSAADEEGELFGKYKTGTEPTTATVKQRPTTIVVQQQQGGDETTTANRFRMEPIFEDDYHQSTIAAQPTSTFPSTTNAAVDTVAIRTTTKRAAYVETGNGKNQWDDGRTNFTFLTRLAFLPDRIFMSTNPGNGQQGEGITNGTAKNNNMAPTTAGATTGTSISTSSTKAPITTSTTPPSPSTTNPIESIGTRSKSLETSTSMGNENEQLYGVNGHLPGFMPQGNRPGSSSAQREKIIFEIFHNGQQAEAVVVGSRITLAFTPYFAIPPSHMSISGCQVEPIGSLYEWEKEPLAIVKEGCQADHVGLVCPPQKTDYGIRVTVEAFRYQTTTQVQYTCLIRVCPFAPCPENTCPMVEGCPEDDIVTRTFGFNRAKRNELGMNLNGIRNALTSLQHDSNQIYKMNNALQQQLIQLGGDSLVRRRLIVVNSDEELRYYTKTGDVPQNRPRN